jgi:hypothetical protein
MVLPFLDSGTRNFYQITRLLNGKILLETKIDSLPLMKRRRILGYLIPAINIPIFINTLYQTFLHYQEGVLTISGPVFWEDFIVLTSGLLLAIAIPRFFPVYSSNYSLKQNGLQVKRLLRRTVQIPRNRSISNTTKERFQVHRLHQC